MTNEDRALLAQDALETHPDYHLNDQTERIMSEYRITVCRNCGYDGESQDKLLQQMIQNRRAASDNVTDLLANLMHLCDAIDISFERSLESARMHYEAECQGEP